jgi:predicted dinucleotide-binding enzyme
MQIGIIGAGHIGATLARHWAELGHDVRIANSRGPETLTALAAETGAKAVSVADAAKAADVVVLSIPEKSVLELPRDLFAKTAASTVVVDTNNYYPEYRDGRIAEIDAGLPDSEWVSRHIGRPVVKAFNNIAAASLRDGAKPKSAPGRIALSVAGDSQEAKRVVIDLIHAIGFDSVDAGTLSSSWRQQPGTAAYCRDLDKSGLERALAEADESRIADYRRAADEFGKRDGATQRRNYIRKA